MMPDTPKVYSLDDLNVHSGSLKSKNLCIHCVVKLHEASQMFMVVDDVREMTVKKLCSANMVCLSICASCSDS